MRIGITSDHRGFKLKNELFKKLEEEYVIVDFGTFGEESVDYPDYAFKVAKKNDIILVTGKGRENYFEENNVRINYSDFDHLLDIRI